MSYEEAKTTILNSKNTKFYKNEVKPLVQNIDVLFDMIFNGLECAMGGDKLINEDNQLQGGDIARLTNLTISLPYYLIEEKYDGVKDFISAYILLCSNYFTIYCTDSKMPQVISTLAKVAQIDASWSRLIIASHALIARAEKLIDVSDTAEIGISKQFISTMMGDHIDFKEK